MNSSLKMDQSFNQLKFFGLNKSGSSPMKGTGYYKINLLTNTISNEDLGETKEQEKFRQYIEEVEKDKNRYIQFKQKMKHQYFKIKSYRQPKLQKPPVLPLQGLIDLRKKQKSPVNDEITTSRTYNVSNSSEINKQLASILQFSLQMALSQQKNKIKVKSKSERENKTKMQIDKQKSLIINFVKKSSTTDINNVKWEDLSNADKYLMNFTDYVRKKTKSAIENDVYDKKVRQKTGEMEKFQDFILEEVKFSADHKQKLSHFFKQIRGEFKKASQVSERCRSTEFKKQTLSKQRLTSRKKYRRANIK